MAARTFSTGLKVAVIAAHDLPPAATTAAVAQHQSGTTPFNLTSVFWRDDDIDFIVEVSLDRKGQLVCKHENDVSWLKLVRLARHCHMQNSQIIFEENQTMRLQITKPIRKGEPLYTWFSIETAKIFQIPFLSPKNILDDCHYSCHRCGQVYEEPNPLKIHMTFYCKEAEVDIPPFKSDKNSAFNRVLPKNTAAGVQITPNFITHSIHPSFMPPTLFSHLTLSKTDDNSPSISTRDKQQSTPPTPTDANSSATTTANVTLREGEDRRRHKCIYCGKLYSRKYGLKIHIRTHTGYKPLKCKVCLRPFGDPSNLNKHVRLHAEGITPYKCQLCGKVLVRRRDLERHLRSRHQTNTQ